MNSQDMNCQDMNTEKSLVFECARICRTHESLDMNPRSLKNARKSNESTEIWAKK